MSVDASVDQKLEDFRNFSIEIDPPDENICDIRVSESLAGSASGKLTLPFSQADLIPFLAASGIPGLLKNPPPTSQTASQLGNQLFESLFQDKIHKKLLRSYPRGNEVLRIQLRMDVREEAMQAVVDLPWELMLDPEEIQPLGLGNKFSITRHLQARTPVQPLPFPSPLKVLAVFPEPSDPDDPHGPSKTQRDAFAASLEKTLGSIEGLELEIIRRNVTFKDVMTRVEDFKPHVLHFLGHGGRRQGEWSLWFEAEDGTSDPISAVTFSRILGKSRDLRLVNLVACNSSGAEFGDNPFNGLAHALVLNTDLNVAVLAMRYNIFIDAAAVFCERFFTSLVRDQRTLDQAVNDGRAAIYTLRPNSVEWITPVLYVRGDSTQIFSPPGSQQVLLNTYNSRARVERDQKFDPEAVVIDLGDLFPGEDVKGRLPKYADSWGRDILPRIKRAFTRLEKPKHIKVKGDAIQSAWMTLGHQFGPPNTWHLSVAQANQKTGKVELWSDKGEPTPVDIESTHSADLGPGGDLAVSIAISTPIEGSVKAHIDERAETHIGNWLQFRPRLDPDRAALDGGREALDLVREIAKIVRRERDRLQAEKIHLFLAGPAAFAFFLGVHLRAAGLIQLYEFEGGSYHPSALLGG